MQDKMFQTAENRSTHTCDQELEQQHVYPQQHWQWEDNEDLSHSAEEREF